MKKEAFKLILGVVIGVLIGAVLFFALGSPISLSPGALSTDEVSPFDLIHEPYYDFPSVPSNPVGPPTLTPTELLCDIKLLADLPEQAFDVCLSHAGGDAGGTGACLDCQRICRDTCTGLFGPGGDCEHTDIIMGFSLNNCLSRCDDRAGRCTGRLL